MARTPVKAALVVLGLVVAVPAANGAMAVFDASALGQAVQQLAEFKKMVTTQMESLGELKKQVDFLTEINGLMDEVSSAIGEVTHITLPLPNLDRMKSQIKRDMQCLMPDGAGWGIRLADLNFGSICESSGKYRDALFSDTAKLKAMPFNEQRIQRHQVEIRRNALLADTTTRALAQSDVQMKQADELNSTADDLQSALAGAKTVQDRVHVQAQIGIAQTRAMAQQNQILAQMLKLHAATAIKAGLAPDTLPADSTGTGETGQ